MNSFQHNISKTRFFRQLKIWLSNLILPGFQGVSLYDSLHFFGKEIFSQRFNSRARAVSFSFLLALAPFLLFIFTLIPYFPIDANKIINTITDSLALITQNENLKQEATLLLENFFLHKKNILLSFSVAITLFFSSNGMLGLMANFDKQLPGFKQRNIFQNRGVAVLLTLLLIAVIFLTVSLLFLHVWATNLFDISFFKNNYFSSGIDLIVILGMIFISISLIYRYGPSTETKWQLITPGSIIATILIILSTIGFFYVVNNVVNYNKIYGSVSTLFIFLLWLLLVSRILLIGFELNVSIFVNKKINNIN